MAVARVEFYRISSALKNDGVSAPIIKERVDDAVDAADLDDPTADNDLIEVPGNKGEAIVVIVTAVEGDVLVDIDDLLPEASKTQGKLVLEGNETAFYALPGSYISLASFDYEVEE